MKKIIYAVTLFALIGMINSANAQTTIASGNWSNPSTWGGTPPMTSGTVVINHTVTLDLDYSHSSGSLTINASGALNGNSPMRVFALNYPNGTATLTVNGSFSVARVLLNSGTVTNSGTFQSDSLLNSSSLANNSGATINASQFMNSTSGTFNNNGSVTSTGLLNISTVTSNGTITSYDFMNSKSFTNSATGLMTVTHDFLNSDSLANPAAFTNNGKVTVNHDWANKGNTAQVNGFGKFCVQNNTMNSGTMSGTFDFCDQTGGNIDLNTGTIAGTITYCLFTCATGIDEYADNTMISIFPNPIQTFAIVKTNFDLNNSILTVYNSFGQTVKQIKNISGQTVTFSRDNLPSGLYFLRLTEDNKTFSVDKLVIVDN